MALTVPRTTLPALPSTQTNNVNTTRPKGMHSYQRPSGPVRRARALALIAPLAFMTIAMAAGAQQPVTRADSAATANARPLSLQEAVTIAQGASDVVNIARNAVTRAHGQQYQARSGLFPQLNANGNYTRTLKSQFQSALSSPAADTTTIPIGPPGPCRQYVFNSDSSTAARVFGLEQYARCTAAGNNGAAAGGINFSKVGFGAANAYTFGLSGSQNLFTGGRLSGQIAASNAIRRSAEVEVTAQRAQLKLDATSAYYDAALSDRLVSIAQATLTQTEDLLRQTQLQQRVGNVSEFDMLRAQVARNNQIPVVLQRQNDREIAYLRLKQLLKLPLDQTLALTTPVEDSTAAPPGVDLARASAPDTVTSHRAAVREAGEAVTAQRGQLRVAQSERIPNLTLSSSYSRVAYPTGIPSLADFRPNWTVTLATSFPIFTGGRIRGDELIAQANLHDARSRLEQAREYAALDSRVALSTLRQAEATFTASEGTAAQAQRAYQIAEVRYREGISTQLELNDIRNQLAQALVNRAQAGRSVQVARVRLALLPELPIQTQSAGQTNLSQQQQQQQQIQQQSPQQSAQQLGAPTQGSPSTGGTQQPGAQPGSNQ